MKLTTFVCLESVENTSDVDIGETYSDVTEHMFAAALLKLEHFPMYQAQKSMIFFAGASPF